MVVKNKKGQALIETLFLLPFIVVVLMLAYQAYILINKNIVAQKYLKGMFVGRVMNRYEATVDHGAAGAPDDGRYFFRFRENNTTKYMNYDLDRATAEMITLFQSDQGEKTALLDRLTNGSKYGVEALGVCIGGGSLLKDQVSYEVFDLSEGDTCSKK